MSPVSLFQPSRIKWEAGLIAGGLEELRKKGLSGLLTALLGMTSHGPLHRKQLALHTKALGTQGPALLGGSPGTESAQSGSYNP